MSLKLIDLVLGDKFGNPSYILNSGESWTIGRGDKCKITVFNSLDKDVRKNVLQNDEIRQKYKKIWERVSHIHCRITQEGEQYKIYDGSGGKASRYGTYVRGEDDPKKIAISAEGEILEDGDIIVLGHYPLKVVFDKT